MPPKRPRPQVAGPGVGGGAQVPSEELQAQGGDVAAARDAARLRLCKVRLLKPTLLMGGGRAPAESENEIEDEGEARGKRRLRELESPVNTAL